MNSDARCCRPDYSYCADYTDKCPFACYHGQIIRELAKGKQVSWKHYENTDDCMKTSPPYEGCHWDCTCHSGANGCVRRKNDPKIKDDFCVGKEICAIEWTGANTCKTCAELANKSYVYCVYGGNR